MKQLSRIVATFGIISLLLVFFVLFHELCHVIIAILTGNGVKGIFLGVTKGYPLLYSLYVGIIYNHLEHAWLIGISGSLGSLILLLPLFLLSLKKNKLYLIFPTTLSITTELIYWTLPLFGFYYGDTNLFYGHLNLLKTNIPTIVGITCLVSVIIIVIPFAIKSSSILTQKTEEMYFKRWIEQCPKY